MTLFLKIMFGYHTLNPLISVISRSADQKSYYPSSSSPPAEISEGHIFLKAAFCFPFQLLGFKDFFFSITPTK